MDEIKINLTVTHTVSPLLEAFLNYFLQLAGGDTENPAAGSTGTETAAQTEEKKKNRRTKAEIEADKLKAAQGIQPVQTPGTVGGFSAIPGGEVTPAVVPEQPGGSFDLNSMLGIPASTSAPVVEVTREQCIEAATLKAKSGKAKEVMDLIAAMGATSVSEIAENKRAEFFQKISTL